MECPSCKFVAAPGQVAEDGTGTCPNCERPYRSQPTPLNSDMAMRDMVAPGEDDMGGNPLQEGILGDYQHGQKRDESYASVHAALTPQFPCPNCGETCNADFCLNCGTSPGWPNVRTQLGEEGKKIPSVYPAEITGVLPPDPGSIHSRLTDLYRQTHE